MYFILTLIGNGRNKVSAFSRAEVLDLCFDFDREAILSPAQSQNIPNFGRKNRNIPNWGHENRNIGRVEHSRNKTKQNITKHNWTGIEKKNWNQFMRDEHWMKLRS